MSNIFFAADIAAKDQNMYQTFIMLGIAGLFFYFILWRPEQKRRKKLESLRQGLKKGDVVVAMGIRATVDEVREKTVVLKLIDGARMEMVLGAISEVEAPKEAPQKA